MTIPVRNELLAKANELELRSARKKLAQLKAACRLTLRFHSGAPWTPDDSTRWENDLHVAYDDETKIDGATTAALCNAVRAALVSAD